MASVFQQVTMIFMCRNARARPFRTRNYESGVDGPLLSPFRSVALFRSRRNKVEVSAAATILTVADRVV